MTENASNRLKFDDFDIENNPFEYHLLHINNWRNCLETITAVQRIM